MFVIFPPSNLSASTLSLWKNWPHHIIIRIVTFQLHQVWITFPLCRIRYRLVNIGKNAVCYGFLASKWYKRFCILLYLHLYTARAFLILNGILIFFRFFRFYFLLLTCATRDFLAPHTGVFSWFSVISVMLFRERMHRRKVAKTNNLFGPSLK